MRINCGLRIAECGFTSGCAVNGHNPQSSPNPQSEIRNRQSIRNPQSEIRNTGERR